MTQFQVSPSSLREMARRLRGIEEELRGLEDRVDSFADDVGSHEVARALEAFAGNWSHRREEMCEHLQTLAGYLIAAADAYGESDAELSSRIEQSGTRSPPAGLPVPQDAGAGR